VVNRQIVALVFVLFSTVVLAAAQAPPPSSQPQNPPSQTPSATAPQSGTTLTGCLYTENQIPGRKPNVAEKAGVLEDYILADAKISGGQDKDKPATSPGATGTTGTAAAQGNMYKIENIPDERLKARVGKRVEVTGRIDPEGSSAASRPGATGGTAPDRGLGPDDINLPEVEAASIREVSGSCPATPAPPRK